MVFQSDPSNVADDDANNAGDVFLSRGPAFVFDDGFENDGLSERSTAVP